jgi:hypothetical protein
MLAEIERALRQASTRIIESVVNFLPGVLVLVVLLAGALIAALIVRFLVARMMRGLDFDRRASFSMPTLADWSPSRSPSQLVARTAYWFVLLLGLLMGFTALDAAIPTRFANSVFGYLPDLLAALVIFIVGGLAARFLAQRVLISAVNMQIRSARLLSLGIKWLVLLVATAMALEHLRIGRTILLLAFGIVFGGTVLAIALAVGLGAKDVVRGALEQQTQDTQAPADKKLDHV